MKNMKLTGLVLAATWLMVVPLARSQQANPPASTKQGGKTSGKGMPAEEQSGKISAVKAERLALQREAEAIEARHQALDAEIAAWSENVGRWMKNNGITIDPARVVLSLSSRSFFLHESQHSGAASGDPEYSHLEDQMKEIQAKRKKIEANWLDLISRDRASIAKNHLKSFETRRSFDFDLGDSTIPIPGTSARQSCCSMTIREGGTTCRYVGDFCIKNNNRWTVWCMYVCTPIPSR